MIPSPTRTPLTPAEALRSPTLFRAWLRRAAPPSFEQATWPSMCPLAQFVLATTQARSAVVGGVSLEYCLPDGTHHGMGVPRWARRFILLWDLWATFWPGRATARAARCWASLAVGVSRVRPSGTHG